MTDPKNYKQLIRYFASHDEKIKKYYCHLPALLGTQFGFDIAIAYLFSRIEFAQNRALYCGLVKLHECKSSIVENILVTWHMRREDFRSKFKMIFGKDIPREIQEKIKDAEKVRDRIVHGNIGVIVEKRKRKAIAGILDYSRELNLFVKNEAGFEPFGSLKGFHGGGHSLTARTTQWILKGMEFPIS